MSQRSMRDGKLILRDAGSNELTIKIGEGNITWSEKRDILYSHNRGAVSEARLGDDSPCDVKFDFVWEWLSSLSGTSVSEAIKGTAGWATTGDNCEPYAVDMILEIYNPDNELFETITFPEFRHSDLSYDLRAGTVTCSGQCKAGGPTVTEKNEVSNGSFDIDLTGWSATGAFEYGDQHAAQVIGDGNYSGTLKQTLSTPIPINSTIRVEFDVIQVDSLPIPGGPNYFWLNLESNNEFEIDINDFGHYSQEIDTHSVVIDEVEIFFQNTTGLKAAQIDNIKIKIIGQTS